MSGAIFVLTTGGTIDKAYFDALSTYQITESMIAKLLERARVTHPFRVVELLRKDSIDMTADDRDWIVAYVRETEANRIVITHGTDTMTDTAKALSTIQKKTLVLTGALAPARFIESDAAFNLGMAFAAAQLAESGVYIAMNGYVFDGNDAIKDRERGFVHRT